jgi:hypothetical protein
MATTISYRLQYESTQDLNPCLGVPAKPPICASCSSLLTAKVSAQAAGFWLVWHGWLPCEINHCRQTISPVVGGHDARPFFSLEIAVGLLCSPLFSFQPLSIEGVDGESLIGRPATLSHFSIRKTRLAPRSAAGWFETTQKTQFRQLCFTTVVENLRFRNINEVSRPGFHSWPRTYPPSASFAPTLGAASFPTSP